MFANGVVVVPVVARVAGLSPRFRLQGYYNAIWANQRLCKFILLNYVRGLHIPCTTFVPPQPSCRHRKHEYFIILKRVRERKKEQKKMNFKQHTNSHFLL